MWPGEIRLICPFFLPSAHTRIDISCLAEIDAPLRASHAEDAEDGALPRISRCQHIPTVPAARTPSVSRGPSLWQLVTGIVPDAFATADVEASTRRQTLQLAAAAVAAACMPGSMVAPGAALAAGVAFSLLHCFFFNPCSLCSSAWMAPQSRMPEPSEDAMLVGACL